MKSTNWKDIAELVGIAAIVGSLVFVGLQMKQSHEIAIAAQYHERAALSIENFNAELESGRLLPVFARINGYEDEADGDIELFAAQEIWYSKFLLLMDNNYFQYESGFVEEESWLSHREAIKRALGQNDRLRAKALSAGALQFRQSFIELCEELIEEHERESRAE